MIKAKVRRVTKSPRSRSKSVMKRKILQSLASMNRSAADLDVYSDRDVTVYFDKKVVIIVTADPDCNELLIRRSTFGKIARHLSRN